ncbi:hypothetical protein GLIP_2270 [Aliiglaciecola lipolytica E3]|uniref:Uncharacterized protein n=1 Tax=Aliiglaciecola lipolytica E3 TaxID=1127673 RepID=K6YE50_9ALTE|nr:hypothetical protein GLIP_2270 [Aliiglaciecola lipolytica E3]
MDYRLKSADTLTHNFNLTLAQLEIYITLHFSNKNVTKV